MEIIYDANLHPLVKYEKFNDSKKHHPRTSTVFMFLQR